MTTSQAISQTFASREEWLAARDMGIGSADAPVIMGLSTYKSPLRLYYEKIGEVPPSAASTERQEWGLLLEEPIARRFERETKRTIIRPAADGYTIQVHPTMPWLRCSVDRFQATAPDSLPPPVPGELGITEIKNADFFIHEQWSDEPPPAFQVQLQHQFAVTGLPWGSIAALIGGNSFKWQDQKRDDEFIALLLEAEQEFKRRCELRDPPPADGSESTKALLKALFPEAVLGKVVPLGAELIDVDAQLRELKTAEGLAKKEIDRLENILKQAIGDAEAGTLPNGIVYTYKNQFNTKDPAGYHVAQVQYRRLNRQAPKEKKLNGAANPGL